MQSHSEFACASRSHTARAYRLTERVSMSARSVSNQRVALLVAASPSLDNAMTLG
jgi:hypothetical protein